MGALNKAGMLNTSIPKQLAENASTGRNLLGSWLVYSVLVGVIAAFSTITFNWTLHRVSHYTVESLGGYQLPWPPSEKPAPDPGDPAPVRWYWLWIIPALGGLVTGWLIQTFAPEAEGHGTDAVIAAYHQKDGFIPLRVPVVKMLASAVTIGTGGCSGREGPICQVAAGFASWLARALQLSPRQTRIMVIAGMGAGIGSMFRVPLGGAMFALDVLYRETEIEYEALLPAMVASIVGYSTVCSLSAHGWGTVLNCWQVRFENPSQLIFYAVLALLLAGVGNMYLRFFYFMKHRVFDPLPVSPLLKPAIGGLCIGSIAIFFPQILGVGYGFIQQAMNGQMTLGLMAMLLAAKFIGMPLTICSGGSGGVFAPTMVIGGLMGGVYGEIVSRLFPTVQIPLAAFILVGMAGFFAGVAKAPFSTLIMVCEMSLGFRLVAPVMLVVAIAYVVVPLRRSIYGSQVNRRIDSPAHEGDFVFDILESIPVRQVLPEANHVISLEQDSLLLEVLVRIAHSSQRSFPVLDRQGGLMGMLDFNTVRSALIEQGGQQLIIAHDLAATNYQPVFWDDNLSIILHKLRASDCEELPVFDQAGGKIIGLIGLTEVLAVYDQNLRLAKSKASARNVSPQG